MTSREKQIIEGTGKFLKFNLRIGTPSLLVVLVTLKAIGILKWSWFATIMFPIFLPFIILFSFLLIIGVIFGLVLLGAVGLDVISSKHRRYKFKRKR